MNFFPAIKFETMSHINKKHYKIYEVKIQNKCHTSQQCGKKRNKVWQKRQQSVAIKATKCGQKGVAY